MSRILRDRSFKLSVVLTLVFLATGIVFLLLGLAQFNWILFGLLPVVLGISIGALPNRRAALIGAAITTLFFLFGLFSMGLSGAMCAVMVLPLIIPLIFLGSVITHLVRKYRVIQADKFHVLILPLLIFLCAAPTSQMLSDSSHKSVEVQSERVYAYTPEEVYDAIKSVDTLDVEKPLLMYFDLPVPVRCVLENEAVGGIRTCHFKGGNLSRGDFGGGTIVERITELDRGRILRMDVTKCDIIGRKWLSFNEAIYTFKAVPGGGCRMVRITTYTSELEPRWYWEPMERLGIEQEHDYVLRNLQNDLEASHGKRAPN